MNINNNIVHLLHTKTPKQIRRLIGDSLGVNGLRKEVITLEEKFTKPELMELNQLYERVKSLEDRVNNKPGSMALSKNHQIAVSSNKLAYEKAAEQYKINVAIHQKDMIFDYLSNHPQFRSKEEATSYYFDDGFSSAQKLLSVLKDICGFDGHQEIHLFEFASGYGCVTRHMKTSIPFCKTTACDIHEEAIRFIREEFGMEAILSEPCPEDLKLGQQFDVVFALSFFSHMPKSTFSRWLKQLSSFIKPGGYLIFTTHGLMSMQFIVDCHFDEDGFYFRSESEQKDISNNEYGTSCVMPQYVFTRIFEIPKFIPKYYFEGYWWKHQDVFVIRKSTE